MVKKSLGPESNLILAETGKSGWRETLRYGLDRLLVSSLFLLCLSIPFDFPIEVGITIYTNEFILLGIFIIYGLQQILSFNPPRQISRYGLITLPFFLAIALSAVHALDPAAVVKQGIRWLEFFLVYWLAIDILHDRHEIRNLLTLLLFVVTLMSILGIIQTLAGPEASINAGTKHLQLFQGTILRAYSTFGHSNQFAGYLILMVPFGFIFFVESSGYQERILWGLLSLILLTALVLTYSRGAWVATLLVGGYLIYENIPKKLLFIIMLVGSLVMVVYILNKQNIRHQQNSIIKRMESIMQYQSDGGIKFRFLCNHIGWSMFKKNPVIGFGAGNYLRQLPKYIDASSEPWKHINKHIHNLYLQVLVETGLLGLITFLFFLGANLFWLLKGYIEIYHKERKPNALYMAFLGSCLAFLINNLTDVLTIYARGIHFSLLLGLAINYMEMIRQEKRLAALSR